MAMEIKICFIILSLMLGIDSFAQISFKTEYLGNSQYWHEIDEDHREKVGNSKGSSMIYQGNLKIPLSMKTNENQQQTIWAIAASGSYAKLDNQNFDDTMVSEIMNLQLGLIYLRPLSQRWSLLSAIGGGVYAPFTDLSEVEFYNVLGNVSVIFIRQLKPNLKLGGGLAINSTFGFPMAFPAIYFDWSLQRNYYIQISMVTGLDIKAGYKFNDSWSLNLVTNMNGQLALLEKDGKDVMLSHQYIIAGLSPEVNLGKHINFSFTAGINCIRPFYYNERSLRGMFTDDAGYYFGTSPYISAGIVIR
jgi:hypothetical protein